MKAEIIAIGTEVLMGQVVNSNAAFISEELSHIGVDVYYHTAVGDNPKRMKQVIQIAKSRSDLIIFTGGLGPTKDDITKHILAQEVGLDLVEDEQSMAYIKSFYEKMNKPMPKGNTNQALTIEGSQVIKNNYGMAPGIFLEQDDITYIMMPGVPSEMKPMMTEDMIPLIQSKHIENSVLESKILRLYKITESQLAESIDELIEKQTNPTIAIYVNNYEPTIRISAKANTKDEALHMIEETEAEIKKVVGRHIYGYGDPSIKDKAIEIMNDLNLTFIIIECGVGNLLSHPFVNSSETESIWKNSLTYPTIEKFMETYELTDDSDESIHSFLNQFAQNQNMLLMKSLDESKSNMPNKVALYVKVNNDITKHTIDLSNRKGVDRTLMEVAMMTRLVDQFN